MTSVIHRVVDPYRVFGSQQLLRALPIALSPQRSQMTNRRKRMPGPRQWEEMAELMERLENLFFRIQSTKKEMGLPYKEAIDN